MEADIYYVDTRNADSRDHRTVVSGPSGGRPMPAFVAQPSRVYSAQQPMYYQPPQSYPPQSYPLMYPPQPTLGSNLLGRVTTGQIIDLVAQIFAALMPLPAAPVATSEAGTDVGNLITYQSALAQYAKRDEQVRTLGNLVTKLVG